jgi:hypothetical protein
VLSGISPAQWLSAGSHVLGSAVRQAPREAISGASSYTTTNSWLDGSGWTVATGRATATASPPPPWLLLAVGAALLWQFGRG